jgi:hypothetical protein
LGREATCTARLDGKSSQGKALLETEELLFRGALFRAAVPFKAMTRVAADDGDLTVVWPGGTLVLALGAPEAARWADKIRNPPARADKLGVKAGMRVAVVGAGARDPNFLREIEARGARIDRAGGGEPQADIVFLSIEARADLRGLAAHKPRIMPDGAIWVLRPKGRDAAVTESEVRAAAKAAGLVDVKVAAFSPTLTAEKLVVPVAARAPARTGAPRARAVKPTRATARSPRGGRSTS